MQTSVYVSRSGNIGAVPILGDTAGLVAYEPCVCFFSVAVGKKKNTTGAAYEIIGIGLQFQGHSVRCGGEVMMVGL